MSKLFATTQRRLHSTLFVTAMIIRAVRKFRTQLRSRRCREFIVAMISELLLEICIKSRLRKHSSFPELFKDAEEISVEFFAVC